MFVHSFIVTLDEFKVTGSYQNQENAVPKKSETLSSSQREDYYLPKVQNGLYVLQFSSTRKQEGEQLVPVPTLSEVISGP